MLKALGLDVKHVTGFTIACQVGEFPAIAVTSVLPAEKGEAAAAVLRQYRLEPIDDVSLPAVDESASLESLNRRVAAAADSAANAGARAATAMEGALSAMQTSERPAEACDASQRRDL